MKTHDIDGSFLEGSPLPWCAHAPCGNWTALWFGKHKGMSLPQVMFKAPAWFFWAYDADVFRGKGNLQVEAERINRRAQAIRVPPGHIAEYVFHPTDFTFVRIDFELANTPPHTDRKSVV